jgi:hypothetical protein
VKKVIRESARRTDKRKRVKKGEEKGGEGSNKRKSVKN